jgi:hypothetical protein
MTLQAPSHRLQCVGWSNVLANSHCCDSLLHWTGAWEMMSSDWQLEQTGVDREAGRLTILDGWDDSWFRLNGLRSKACCMTQPIGNSDFLPGQRITR